MKDSGGAWTWVVAGVALAAALAVTVFGCRAPEADADSSSAAVPRRGDTSYLPTIEPPVDRCSPASEQTVVLYVDPLPE
jgi:hypothetical protein